MSKYYYSYYCQILKPRLEKVDFYINNHNMLMGQIGAVSQQAGPSMENT